MFEPTWDDVIAIRARGGIGDRGGALKGVADRMSKYLLAEGREAYRKWRRINEFTPHRRRFDALRQKIDKMYD